MRKNIITLSVILIIIMLVISSSTTLSVTKNSQKPENSFDDNSSGPLIDDDFILMRFFRLLTGNIKDIDISEDANIDPSKINANVISDIVLVWNATLSQFLIPDDYYVGDVGYLKIEDLPNLVERLGGTTQKLVETNIKRLVIKVETYAENYMELFTGPCWAVPGLLTEEDGKARWELEFTGADGSSYGTTNWKLLIVTTYLI